MRSKRTRKSSSIRTGESAPNGSEARDQTSSPSAEDARREAEQKYRDIFENAVEGIFQTRPGGGFITANPALARMLGFASPEELIRARAQAIGGTYYVHPERRVEFKRLLDQHDTVRGFEFEAYRKDGTKIWMSDNVRAVRDASGELLYYEGTTEDITKRKLAEEALRENEERYRDLVENSRDLICTHDLDGLVLSANPAAAAAVGYDLDEFVGKKTIRDLLAPEVKDQFDEYMARLRKEGTTSGIMLVQTKSGERRVWEYYNSLRTEGVATPIVRGMARDITEQRRAEKATSNLRRELELTMNSMAEGIHRVDLNGNIVFENPAAVRMLGWEVAELVGKRGHPTMHHTRPDGTPYPQEECPIYATFRDGVSRHVTDEVFWRQDGTSFPVEYTTAPVRDDQNELVATVVTFRDITDRKRAEEALLASERRYHDIFAFAPVGIYQSLRDGTLITANKALAEMLAYDSVDEFLKINLADVYFVQHGRKKLIREYEDRGFAIDLEIQWRRKDGAPIWVQLSAHAIKGANGATEYFEGFVRDVNDRKLTEAALRESETRFSKAFHSNPAPLIITRLDDGCFLNVNDAFLRAFEYERAEVIGETVLSLNIYPNPEDRKSLIDQLKEQGALRGYESQARTKSGRILDLWVSVEPITLQGQQCILSTAYDVTERKRIEEALRESEERYRELFENDKDAIYVHDLKGVYTSVNRAGEKLVGYSREEILGRPFQDFVAPEYVRQVCENFGKKLEETGETNYELEIIKRGGARVPLEVSSRPIYKNGIVVGVQGSARDITDRKRAQQALLTYSRRLLEAQESERGRIARELHDQVGQMLTALKLNLHAIQSARDANEARLLLEDNLKMIDEALEQVRDLSVDLRPLLLDDLGLVTALRWFIDHQAQRTGVRAEFTSDSLDPDLRFSPELETACFRIAQEALTNIARHAGAKTVTVRLSRNRDYLILLVEDDGAGFEIESLQDHAQPNATLGLRGMQERAQAVGGRVKIDSATDRGTQVFVELPIAMPNGARPQL